MKLKEYIFLLLLLLSNLANAQMSSTKVYAKFDNADNKVQLKWYLPNFTKEEPVLLWLQMPDGQWQKLQNEPFAFNPLAVQASLSEKEKEVFALLKSKQSLQGVAFLHVLMQSFYSQNIANTSSFGCTINQDKFQKLTRLKITGYQSQKTYFTGVPISTSPGELELKPVTLEATTVKKSNTLKWSLPPHSFWSVLLYRRHADSSIAHCITPLPLLSSLDTTDEKARRFIDAHAKEKQSYLYHLKGITHFGDTIILTQELLMKIPDSTSPESITNLHATFSKRTVSLSWTASSSADCSDIEILRTTKNDTDFTSIGNLKNQLLSVFVDTVKKYQSYFYKIRSIDSSGNYTDSETLPVEVPDQEAPDKPSITKLISDSLSITLNWKVAPQPDFAGCYVFRAINDTAANYFVRITPEPILATTYTDMLPTNTKNKYFYKLIALDSSLNYSPYSAIASCRLPDKTPPSRVFVTSLVQQNLCLKISWFKNPESDLQSYHIVLRDSTAHSFLRKKIQHRDSLQFYYEDLLPNHFYLVNVLAQDSASNISSKSNDHFQFMRIAPKDDEEIGKFKLHGQKAEDMMAYQLRWQLQTNDTVLGCTIYRSDNLSNTLLPYSGFIKTETEFIDKSLQLNTTYSYQVQALLKTGAVIKSTSLIVTTDEKGNIKKQKRNK